MAIFLFEAIYNYKPFTMKIIDTTLQKIRKFNSDAQLLAEAEEAKSQPLDDFVKEVQAYYTKRGLNIPEKVIRFVIKVYGVSAAHDSALSLRTKKALTDEGRFVGNILKQLGITTEELADKVDQQGNVAQDPEITKKIDEMMKLLVNSESHQSMINSTTQNMSSDLLSIAQKMPEYADLMKELIEQVKKLGDVANGKKVKTSFDNQILTNMDVAFSQGSLDKILKGRVLMDSDDQANLTQDYIDAINGGQNPPPIKETLAQIGSAEFAHHVWVQVQGKVFVVPKAALHTANEAKQISDFLQKASPEVVSLFKKPKLFYHSISGQKEDWDEKDRIKAAHGDGKFDWHADRISQRNAKLGMTPLPREDGGETESSGQWYSEIYASARNTPILLTLDWISKNTHNSGISFDGNKITIKKASLSNGVLSTKYFKAQSDGNKRSPTVADFSVLKVQGVDTKKLLYFCQSKKINVAEQGSWLIIKNEYTH